MAGDFPLWIGRYAELLGCDCRPASIAVAIEDLLAERERQRKAIGHLRGRNAELLHTKAQAAESKSFQCDYAVNHSSAE